MNPLAKINNTTVIRKNRQLLMVLALVPEFQREVKSLRKRFEIPPDGYPFDSAESRREVDLKIGMESRSLDDKQLGMFSKPMFGFEIPTSPRPFQQEIMRIGRKFKLPYNLYSNCTSGVAWMVICDRIAVEDRNWDIEHDFKYGNELCRWISLKAYTPLSKEEIQEAMSALNKELKVRLYPSLSKDRRVHDQFENVMDILEEMLKRTERPKKKKTYTPGGYLDTVKKAKISDKRLRQLEKIHRGEVSMVSTVRSWKEAAGRKAPKTKALLKRLKKLAVYYFGYGLTDRDESGTH